MTYLEIVEEVLKHSKKPLSYMEIWREAERLGFASKKEIQGKTPWNTISALISLDIRDNPNTYFVKVEEKPTKYGLVNWERSNQIETIENNDNEMVEGDDIDNYETDVQIFDPLKQDIDPIQDKWSVFDHIRKLKNGRLIIENIEFQRKFVWDIEKQSRFIESILMGFPIPPFYLNAKPDGAYIIIDGLQRTKTLSYFLKDEFSLKGLHSLKQLERKKFSDLPMALQAKIEDKGLNVYILKATTPPRVIYELFDRINTGGTQLTRQEVRNGIFIGKSTRLLKEIAHDEIFEQATDYGVGQSRMKDEEMVLRYLAFKLQGYESYRDDLSPFVELAMAMMNDMADKELEKLKVDAKRAFEWSYKLFGKQNFRIPLYEENGSIKDRRGAINVSVLESVCYVLSNCSDEFLAKNKEKINKNYYELTKNKQYLESVKTSTGNVKKVHTRFQLAQEILTKI
ncbi:MAG: DUF262 domain-containing protein [Bacteroidia bacterium]|nr:DUF262 domain-containing protein [Bacteroidia bacterium]